MWWVVSTAWAAGGAGVVRGHIKRRGHTAFFPRTPDPNSRSSHPRTGRPSVLGAWGGLVDPDTASPDQHLLQLCHCRTHCCLYHAVTRRIFVEHCLYQYLHREAMGKRLGEVSCDTQPPTPATHQLILDVGNTFLRLCSIVCTYNFCASRRTFACVEHPSFSPPRSPPGPHHGPTVGPRTNHATTRSRTRQRWRLYTFVLRLFLYVSPVRQ